jgi:hypothetical protein
MKMTSQTGEIKTTQIKLTKNKYTTNHLTAKTQKSYCLSHKHETKELTGQPNKSRAIRTD